MAPPHRSASPPALMDELIGEILLRIPPEEPADLIRASLVCKPWLRLLSDPTFPRRYREFHRTPPLLAFLHNANLEDGDLSLDDDDDDDDDDEDIATGRFVPTTTASPLTPPALGSCSWWALDCRHGRVLLHKFGAVGGLVIWDPITGSQKQVPLPVYPHTYCTAAVLCGCAVVGCDHLDCCGGPFLVVFVGTDDDGNEMETWASVYSSETSAWSARTAVDLSVSANVGNNSYVEMRPSHLTGNALYFMLELGKSILKFDLVKQSLSVVDPPELYDQSSIVMTAEDGALGFAGMKDNSLDLWSWEDGSGWVLCRVIELDGLIPIGNGSLLPDVIGSVENTHSIFVSTDAGVFTLDLKSGNVRKVGEKGAYVAVVPYTSFYAPDLRGVRLSLP